MTLRIGNGAGFLGDQLDAPRLLVENSPLDYLTLEYLAELTMSILAHQKQKQPDAGYARDFLEVLSSLIPALSSRPEWKVITNAGGVNPRGCTIATARRLTDAGLGDVRIGLVEGDDLLKDFDQLQASGQAFAHMDNAVPFATLSKPAVAANAYLGAAMITAALDEDARIVITGRVADASLTVAPAVHHYGWEWDDFQLLAAASVAGHLIECGAQVTGGYSQRWQDLRLDDVGYPIAEMEPDGSTVITKPNGTGGRVDRQSVVEQLVYEISDPRCYRTPDVNVDFTQVRVQDLGADRVLVSGAAGQPPGDQYKVSLAYHDGYMAHAQLLVVGRDCLEKAQHCADIIERRLQRAGFATPQLHIECLGGGGYLLADPPSVKPRELMLRLSVYDENREVVERFTREIAPLITSGPAGLAGYATARSNVHPVFAYWPTLVSKSVVQPTFEVRAARQWAVH